MKTKNILSIVLLSILALTPIYQASAQNEMEQDMFAMMKGNDKAAIVAVHFGTTNENARIQSIDRFNDKLQQAFPDVTIREAWTSRIVIKKLKEREVIKHTPSEVLEQLYLDGYTHILIQSSNIIDGTEMEYLRHEVESFKQSFKQIRIAAPLLDAVADYEHAVEAVDKVIKDKKSINVLVCHGTKGNANAQYTMLDYVIRDKDFSNWAVATIEGYPTLDNLIRNIKKKNIKKINLIPFMFVAGEHVQNDISVEWKKALEAEGFKVKVFTKGLGENDDIIQIFISHAKHTQKYHSLSAIERKLKAK